MGKSKNRRWRKEERDDVAPRQSRRHVKWFIEATELVEEVEQDLKELEKELNEKETVNVS